MSLLLQLLIAGCLTTSGQDVSVGREVASVRIDDILTRKDDSDFECYMQVTARIERQGKVRGKFISFYAVRTRYGVVSDDIGLVELKDLDKLRKGLDKLRKIEAEGGKSASFDIGHGMHFQVGDGNLIVKCGWVVAYPSGSTAHLLNVVQELHRKLKKA